MTNTAHEATASSRVKYEQANATLTLIRTFGFIAPDVGVRTVIFKALRKFEVLELKLELVER